MSLLTWIGSIRQYLSFEATRTLLFSLGLIIVMLYFLALLRFSLINKIQIVISCSARLIGKALESAHIILLITISSGYQLAAGFNTK